ncbi:MAG TPA: ROK family protein [bacterium]|nr:ROK family protein [bacterium]
MSEIPEVVAVDMGGTLLRVGVVTADRTMAQQWVHRIEGRRGAAPIGALLQSALREAAGWMSAHTRYPVGVGIAVPGVVEPEDGIVRYSANLDLHNVPLAALAREVIPAPVAVENDVRAAAWGEYAWGSGMGTRYMVYLSAGTGIAAAVIDDGRPYRGISGAAGELGHAPVFPDGERCSCGNVGCLETVAAGWGIVHRAAQSGMVGVGAGPGRSSEAALTVEAVFEAAATGDRAATAVLSDAGVYLGQAAVSLVRLLNPQKLILGGGLFFAGSPLVAAVTAAVEGVSLSGETPPRVSLAAFGSNSGLIGAACLLLSPESASRPWEVS